MTIWTAGEVLVALVIAHVLKGFGTSWHGHCGIASAGRRNVACAVGESHDIKPDIL